MYNQALSRVWSTRASTPGITELLLSPVTMVNVHNGPFCILPVVQHWVAVEARCYKTAPLPQFATLRYVTNSLQTRQNLIVSVFFFSVRNHSFGITLFRTLMKKLIQHRWYIWYHLPPHKTLCPPYE